jgi:hypothetical protein
VTLGEILKRYFIKLLYINYWSRKGKKGIKVQLELIPIIHDYFLSKSIWRALEAFWLWD